MLFSSFTVTSNKRQREGASLLTMGATFNYNYMPVASYLIWKPELETQRASNGDRHNNHYGIRINIFKYFFLGRKS